MRAYFGVAGLGCAESPFGLFSRSAQFDSGQGDDSSHEDGLDGVHRGVPSGVGDGRHNVERFESDGSRVGR